MRKGILVGIVLAVALMFSSVASADVCPCPTVFQGDEPWAMSGSYLGVDTRDVTTDRVAALKLKDESGVEVTMVDQDAPAGKAGLKEKDVILTFNGQKVEGVEQLRRMIREVPPGRQVALGISRDGQMLNVPVTLGDRRVAMKNHIKKRIIVNGPNGSGAGFGSGMGDMPMADFPPMDMDIPSINVFTTTRRSGVMVENLTSQLADFFGVKNNAGVLVRSVEKGSAAESGGLKAGDVIVRLDKEPITDVGDWRRVTRGRTGTASVVVIRDKREQTLQIKFPERKPKENSWMQDGSMDIDIDLGDLESSMKALRPTIAEQEKMAKLISKNVELHRGEWEKAARESAVAAQKFMSENKNLQNEINQKVQKALQQQKKALDQMQKDFPQLLPED